MTSSMHNDDCDLVIYQPVNYYVITSYHIIIYITHSHTILVLSIHGSSCMSLKVPLLLMFIRRFMQMSVVTSTQRDLVIIQSCLVSLHLLSSGSGSGSGKGVINERTVPPTTLLNQQVYASLADLLGKLRDGVITSFLQRSALYDADIRRLDSLRGSTQFDFWQLFLVKESYALMYQMM